MRMMLADIAAAVKAASAALPELTVTAVSTDSRTVQPGELFLCLKGENFDGHDYAATAAGLGAAAVVTQRRLDGVDAPQLLVADTGKALLELGAVWRQAMQAKGVKVLAVTGSAGKTTVKELLAGVLGSQLRVHKSTGNFNNQVGLPLSLLAAGGDEDAVVVEVGISKAHDMAELAPVAGPDVAIVHNIGPAHLEGLGSLAGVAKAKAGLLEALAPGGKALVSKDYPELAQAARALRQDCVWMSATDPETEVYCGYLGVSQGEGGNRRGTYLLRLGDDRLEMELPFHGAHLAENVAAAAGAAHLLGLGADAIAEALAGAELPKQRFALRDMGGLTVIDDSYNANPLSMTRSVQAAAELAGSRPLVLVLGDMGELGRAAEAEHLGLGRVAGMIRPAAVVYRGSMAPAVRRGLEEASFEGEFEELAEADALPGLLARHGLSRGVVLVKGSRSAKMEEFVIALENAARLDAGDA